ncbi:MAG: hypothetical protein CMJ78_13565 [Planctomycetaceae bacterium]|nr:hypothetical protein [Planctomycetaceae bacterium]
MNYFMFSCQYNDGDAFREPATRPPTRPKIEILTDFTGAPNSQYERCKACGELKNKWQHTPSGIGFKKYDSSKTYDGLWKTSTEFQTCCLEHAIQGISFVPIPNSDFLFVSIPSLRSNPMC